jgi:hypothetical protein
MSKLFAVPLEAYVRATDRARLSSFLLVAARNSRVEICFVRHDGTHLLTRIELAAFADGYLTLLITDLGPLHRLHEAGDSLTTIREALAALERAPALDAAARQAVEAIGPEVKRLSALLDAVFDATPAASVVAQETGESPSPVKR